MRRRLGKLTEAVSKAYPEWLDEVYYTVHVREVTGANGKVLPAAELLAEHGTAIAQIVRGELNPLSPAEERELLGSSMSYYPSDLLVVGWMAGFIYDTAEGAAATEQLLEYANTQLLEYRRYDEVFTRVLKRAYDSLERCTAWSAIRRRRCSFSSPATARNSGTVPTGLMTTNSVTKSWNSL